MHKYENCSIAIVVDHVNSSSYVLKKMVKIETIDKTLLRILSRMIYEEPKKWVDTPLSLSPPMGISHLEAHSNRGQTSSLVYGTDMVMVPLA